LARPVDDWAVRKIIAYYTKVSLSRAGWIHLGANNKNLQQTTAQR